jgi:hypothetical protein
MVTGWTVRGSSPGVGEIFRTCPGRPWSPPSLLYNGYRVFPGGKEQARPLGRPRHRWEDNIKMDLQEIGVGRGDWMELAQDRDRWRALVGNVRDFRVP